MRHANTFASKMRYKKGHPRVTLTCCVLGVVPMFSIQLVISRSLLLFDP